MNILLLDDEKDCILSLALALEPTGHRIELFTVPGEGVEACRRANFDVVITDMRMPDMNGIQVLKQVREINLTTRVIMITGYGDVDTAMAAINNGAYAFFAKPVVIEDILLALEKIDQEKADEKKVLAEKTKMAEEYNKLKKAYEEIQEMLKQVTREKGGIDGGRIR